MEFEGVTSILSEWSTPSIFSRRHAAKQSGSAGSRRQSLIEVRRTIGHGSPAETIS